MTITGAFLGFTLALRTPGSYFPTRAEAEGWGGGGESSFEEQVDSDGREQEMSSLHVIAPSPRSDCECVCGRSLALGAPRSRSVWQKFPLPRCPGERFPSAVLTAPGPPPSSTNFFLTRKGPYWRDAPSGTTAASHRGARPCSRKHAQRQRLSVHGMNHSETRAVQQKHGALLALFSNYKDSRHKYQTLLFHMTVD